jgi:hypothetical protein
MSDIVESKIKSWLAPFLISAFGIVFWSMVSEIRSDVKALLAANAEVQVKIQNLEKRMDGLETVVYSQRLFAIKPDEIEAPKRSKKQVN